MASETFQLGDEQAIASVDITLSASTFDVSLTGMVGPHTVPTGKHHRLQGVVTLTGDLTVEGLLSCDPDVTVDGQGNQLLVQNGGRLDLAGTEKVAWTRNAPDPGWGPGDEVVEYVPADPTRDTKYLNLTRTANFSNLSRVMMHMGAGVQNLKYVSFDQCGGFGQLGFYPVHFHLNADTVRGSLVEGVVVSRSQNRGFVPHGSHGVTFRDCIAYDIEGEAYWWDSQDERHTEDFGFHNRSNDTLYDRCVAAKVTVDPGTNPMFNKAGFHRLGGFWLGSGNNNSCINSLAVDVVAGVDSSGFLWPEGDISSWLFEDCEAHDCNEGIFVWQNSSLVHDITRFTGHGNGFRGDIRHGAYNNVYHYIDIDVDRFVLLANSRLVDGRVLTIRGGRIGFLVVDHHNLAGSTATVVRNVDLGAVRYNEKDGHSSHIRYEDCDVVPADFDMAGARPDTIVEIIVNGSVTDTWAGSWS